MSSELQNRAFQLCGMSLIHTSHKQPSHLLASPQKAFTSDYPAHLIKIIQECLTVVRWSRARNIRCIATHCPLHGFQGDPRWQSSAAYCSVQYFLRSSIFFQMSSSMHHVTRQPLPSPWSLYGEHPRGTKASRLQWMNHTLAQITTQELYPQRERGTSRPVNYALKNAIKMWQNFNLQLIWN